MKKNSIVTLVILFAISIISAGQTIDYKIIENGGSGAYKAYAVSDSLFADFTIYRPQDLKATVAKEGKLPVLLFANGGCGNSSIFDETGLNKIASNGYIVIAIGPFNKSTEGGFGGFGGERTSAYQLLEALDLIIKENYRQESEYYNMVDVNKVAAMGGSCGGLQAIAISYDPRIKTTIMQNSGVFDSSSENGQGMNISEMVGAEFEKDDLKELHAPIVYVIGNETDVAYPNAQDDYSRIDHIPVALCSYNLVGHEGTSGKPDGGAFAIIQLGWLDWQFKGKTEKSALFLDKNYAKTHFPDWAIKAKNF